MSSEEKKAQCSFMRRVGRGYPRYHKQCTHVAKVTRDVKPYCGVHDPVARQAKRDAQDAKWRAEWAEKDKARDRAQRIADAERAVIEAAEAWFSEGATYPESIISAIAALRKARES